MTIREIRAAQKRQERESRNRLRELERQRKEQAKLSALEQARLQVEMYENQIEVILSIHKECGVGWDWHAVAADLYCHPPERWRTTEIKARIAQVYSDRVPAADLDGAVQLDDLHFQEATAACFQELESTRALRELATRILRGEHKAYTEALVQFSPVTELSELGSSIHFTVHSKTIVEAVLNVNGKQAIPGELKSLTAAGKLSVKAMPKGRFHEIYQDYVCGCVLRVAREVFALLPVQTMIVTALAEASARGGLEQARPVLTVAIPRQGMANLDFASLDPSDALESFLHRGDAKASRRSGEFSAVVPLTPADLAKSPEEMGLSELIKNSRSLRQQCAVLK